MSLLVSACGSPATPDHSPTWVSFNPGVEIAFLAQSDGSERFWTFTSVDEPAPELPIPGRFISIERTDAEPDVLHLEFVGYLETTTVSIRFEDGVVITAPIRWD